MRAHVHGVCETVCDILGSAAVVSSWKWTWLPSLFVNHTLWTELLAEPQETSPSSEDGLKVKTAGGPLASLPALVSLGPSGPTPECSHSANASSRKPAGNHREVMLALGLSAFPPVCLTAPFEM